MLPNPFALQDISATTAQAVQRGTRQEKKKVQRKLSPIFHQGFGNDYYIELIADFME